MTPQIQWISREAEDLLELAEWNAHVARDFACKGLVVARTEDRSRYQGLIDELGELAVRRLAS